MFLTPPLNAQALSSESSSNVDRRIVGKLLVTFFEKGHCKEVLKLMASMLVSGWINKAWSCGVGGGRVRVL